ncbi:MAG: transposase [Pirellulales bacterium]|nr:transposase [Pirellulales bacterium]
MNRVDGHRKQVKHFDNLTDVRELTFSCFERRPLLTNDCWRTMLARSIDAALNRHQYRLAAFVFMPEHVHLVVWPMRDTSSMQSVLKAIKRPFSYRVKQHLIASGSPLLRQLTVQQRPGVMTFRFWQEGPGYDRNLTRGATLLASIDYVHQNPVRRSLAKSSDDWPWSSARWFRNPSDELDSRLPKLNRLPPHWLD